MSCPQIILSDIDDALYARLLQQAIRAGAKFPRQDVMEHSGCEFTFTRTAATVVVTCTKKPWYASCETVASRLNQLIESAKEAA